MPAGANLTSGRLVLAIKNVSANEEMFKYRFVVKGYRDKLKTRLLHDATTSRISSARLLVGPAAVLVSVYSRLTLLKHICKVHSR
jgi:hypothetical protein